MALNVDKFPGNGDHNTAATRTTVNMLVLAVIAYFGQMATGRDFDTSDPTILVAVGLIVGLGTRLSYVVTSKWPSVGYVLFGMTKPPTY